MPHPGLHHTIPKLSIIMHLTLHASRNFPRNLQQRPPFTLSRPNITIEHWPTQRLLDSKNLLPLWFSQRLQLRILSSMVTSGMSWQKWWNSQEGNWWNRMIGSNGTNLNTCNLTSTINNLCLATHFLQTTNWLSFTLFGHMSLKNLTGARRLVVFVTDLLVLDRYESSTTHMPIAWTEQAHGYSIPYPRPRIC